MRNRIASVLACAAIATTGTVAVAPSAEAAGCVSQAEFRKAKKGMKVAKVHRVFGTKGKRDSITRGGGMVIEIRSYKTCTPYGAVSVLYDGGRLDVKSAVF